MFLIFLTVWITRGTQNVFILPLYIGLQINIIHSASEEPFLFINWNASIWGTQLVGHFQIFVFLMFALPVLWCPWTVFDQKSSFVTLSLYLWWDNFCISSKSKCISSGVIWIKTLLAQSPCLDFFSFTKNFLKRVGISCR